MSRPYHRNPLLAEALERNIDVLLEERKQLNKRRNIQDRTADFITSFSGTTSFLFLHVLWFGIWIAINLGYMGIEPFDPYPFGLLTMIVSLEAIFLSTFVLISQNRISAASDERSDLDLHINLLAEYEITKVLKIVDGIADHLGLKQGKDPELRELEREISPIALLKEIEERRKEKHMRQNTPEQE